MCITDSRRTHTRTRTHRRQTNFFEKRVAEYQLSNVANATTESSPLRVHQHKFVLDVDF